MPLTPGGNQDGGVIGDVKPVPPVRVPLPQPLPSVNQQPLPTRFVTVLGADLDQQPTINAKIGISK